MRAFVVASGTLLLTACGMGAEPMIAPPAQDAGAAVPEQPSWSECALICHSFANCWDLFGSARANAWNGPGGTCMVDRHADGFRACVDGCEAARRSEKAPEAGDACVGAALAEGNRICQSAHEREILAECPEFSAFAAEANSGIRTALECWTSETRPERRCVEMPGWTDVSLNAFHLGRNVPLSHTGTTTVIRADDAVWLYPVQGTTVAVSLNDSRAPGFVLGGEIDVEVDYTPGRPPQQFFSIRSATGETIYAAWSFAVPSLEEVEVSYEYAGCTSVDADCGESIDLDMRVVIAGSPVLVAPGESTIVHPYQLTNGRSIAIVNLGNCLHTAGAGIYGSLRRW